MLKPSSFGDIIHTLPAVSRLKAAWPDCQISWLANPEWMPLLEGNSTLAEIVPFPRKDFSGWSGGWRLLRWLRSPAVQRAPDLALDFQGLLRTALIGRASRARTFVGLSDAREGATWFYHRTVESPSQPVHAVTRYLALANAMTTGLGVEQDVIDFPLPPGSPMEIPPDFGDGFILLHPYARGKGKSLSDNDIDNFILKFSRRRVVLVGRGGRPMMIRNQRCLNLLDKTSIAQLIWLIRRASFVVSVDSGPAHLAAALGRPMIAIHAWSDPRRVGPYRQDAWVWKNGRVIRVRDLSAMEDDFFAPKPLHLREADVEAIAGLATSP